MNNSSVLCVNFVFDVLYYEFKKISSIVTLAGSYYIRKPIKSAINKKRYKNRIHSVVAKLLLELFF